MKKTIILSVSTAILLFASTSISDSMIKEDKEAEKLTEQLVIATGISAENMLILNQKKTSLSNLDEKLTLFKLLNKRTGEGKTVVLDEQSNQVNYEQLKEENRKIRFDKMGAMNEALFKKISDGGDIPVMLQLAVKKNFIDKNKFEGKKTKLKEIALKEQNKVDEESKKLFTIIENEYNLKLSKKASFSGPFVSLVLASNIIEKLSKDSRIIFMGRDKEEIIEYAAPTIPQSIPTTRTDYAHNQGFRGEGVNITVLEPGILTTPSSCFHLTDIQSTSGSASPHMTKSLGIIGNRYNTNNGLCNSTWKGYAPASNIYLANSTNAGTINFDYQNAYEWAKKRNINIVTMSWGYKSEETNGDMSSRDKYFDYQVSQYPYPSIFAAAGNQKDGPYVASKGYNFMAIGNINNDGDGNRCNDTIVTSSSWLNPNSPMSDREKPEIASPGSRHSLLGTTFGGTSAACPVTASIAAVLMSMNTQLKLHPEAVRSILQAGANYQGADGNEFSEFDDGQDGTGMTNTYYSYGIAKKRETGTTPQYRAHDYGTMSYSDFSNGYFNKTWNIKVPLKKSRVRVALTWNSQTDEPYWWWEDYTSTLMGDLDLIVRDPSGNIVDSSTSVDNNNEFVEFTPTVSGNYTINILGFNIPKEKKIIYSIAWTTHYDFCN